MIIGIPKEIKDMEFRVGATPDAVKMMIDADHKVFVETGAGAQIGFSDQMYKAAGAKIVSSAKEVYKAEMIIKVKEPLKSEYDLLYEGQILFCYLHLAPDPEQTKALLDKKVIGIAYETVTDKTGRLPLLTPMSEVAGRLAVQVGATYLQMTHGGKGVLLGGVPGVRSGRVVVLGAGVVGSEALKMALGLGAQVTVFDKNLHRLRKLDCRYFPTLSTAYPTTTAIEQAIAEADLVVGAILVAGGKAPVVATRAMVKNMQKGSVIVDVAIDQGGCVETSRLTSHSEPIYEDEGVLHYCVPNMPSLCARTSTQGLTNAILPFALKLANLGVEKALQEDLHLLNGLNVYKGHVTNENVAKALNYEYRPLHTLFSSEAEKLTEEKIEEVLSRH